METKELEFSPVDLLLGWIRLCLFAIALIAMAWKIKTTEAEVDQLQRDMDSVKARIEMPIVDVP